MPTPILMPALSPTMEQGKLAKWLKKEGDKVSSGDAIAEIETEKATVKVEAWDEGVMGKIMIAEGTEGVAVNTPIAVLLSEGEDAASLKGYGAEPPQPAGAAPLAKSETAAVRPAPQAEAKAPAAASQAPAANRHRRIFITPLGRRLAEQAGINLSQGRGSGPHGPIVQDDIDETAKSGTATARAPGTQPAAPQMAGPQNGGIQSQSLVPARTVAGPMPDEQ